jgi:hypothetical protein
MFRSFSREKIRPVSETSKPRPYIGLVFLQARLCAEPLERKPIADEAKASIALIAALYRDFARSSHRVFLSASFDL